MKIPPPVRPWALAVPACSIIVVYLLISGWNRGLRLSALANKVQRIHETLPTTGRITETRTARDATNRLAVALEADETAQYTRLWASLGAHASDASRRAAADWLADMFDRNQVALLELVPTQIEPSALYPSLRPLNDYFKTTRGAQSPGFWRAKLSGGYLDVLSAMRELAASDHLVIVLSLSWTDRSDGLGIPVGASPGNDRPWDSIPGVANDSKASEMNDAWSLVLWM